MRKYLAHRFGPVYLVGAGPGDPGLFTLRGVETLRRADLVLYDYLVNPQLLEHARTGAELVCLGRHGRAPRLSQTEINARMVEAAQQGRTVVRLKAGDPAVFARFGEETDALTAAGVPFEIVPGITAALASGSHAGIPLTHRKFASAVALVTGHEDADKCEPAVEYRALASFPGTIVMYMGVTTVGEWSAALIEGGKSASTPVAIVRRCSWSDQTVQRTTLGGLPALVAEQRLRPPVIFIVGEAAAAESSVSWFATRPLFGQRIIVTRPEGQSFALRDPLQELGAEVRIQPAIAIEPPADWSAVDAAIGRVSEFDWLVFSSSNGVRMWFDRWWSLGGDWRRLANTKLAAIGPGTSDELAKYHLRADRLPDGEYRAEALAQALNAEAAGKRFLLVRASRGREVLAEQLQAAGGHVEQVVAYRSVDVTVPDAELTGLLHAGEVDWVTVTSSAIARSLAAMWGDALRRAKLASISPITSQTLRELGFTPHVEATEYTMPGLVDAIVRSVTTDARG
ncbi:MAG: uroporphyrinogen-III C-methyltransferase [Planctomycetaceae bacterium]|nr:uroporphyrinogen-III C-methyltransferase [Planctomycetaceae bacterium]